MVNRNYTKEEIHMWLTGGLKKWGSIINYVFFETQNEQKIEMKQIGYRAEAGRLGGIGSCGRELCCSTWLTDFRAVSTSAARYQQLSLNPTKLAGQCGKLKCCLNYELDQYVEAVKDLPPTHVKLRLPKGTANHFKTDIFKKVVYYKLNINKYMP